MNNHGDTETQNSIGNELTRTRFSRSEILNLFYIKFLIFFSVSLCLRGEIFSQTPNLKQIFQNPPESAKPWVFWYWMEGAVSREGITADLEAMKQAGIEGAYLVPIRSSTNPLIYSPPVNQLTPEWFGMVRFAMQEADRLGLKFAMHSSDGFATAGGPWITPELSMQKVVWTKTLVTGNKTFSDTLPRPESYKGFYKDIAVLAFPAPDGSEVSTRSTIPVVTTNIPGEDAGFLVKDGNKTVLKSEDSCWIQYAFAKPFTCRTIVTRGVANNAQSHRLRLEVSDDGINFRYVCQLHSPRQGWFDTDVDVTHSVEPVTAKYFRFIYNKAGSEPGAEDLETAKWRPSLKIRGIELFSAPSVNQLEGKNGQVWRVGPRTTEEQVPDSLCVPLDKIIDLTSKMDSDGHLTWNVPNGNWIILRIGHTSTGRMNETAGTGKGLECDKMNPEAIKLQFGNWFGEIINQVGPDLAGKVLKVFHVDSWECGSQNWSPVFRDEFRKRRGYDLLPYLPAMAGIPVKSADVTEKFLSDVRETIAELVTDNFYGTLAKLAHEKGCAFTGEAVAPVMTSDGMLHYKYVDIPMGEFWVNSPTHDKPGDMLDAVSGGHIYGKNIIQAEGFTTLRMDWNENPAMLKAIGDRNFALGINRLVYHVFVHNPWPDRRPGMTLGPIGLYFQRDQTWWKPGEAWVEYALRCQALLQQGTPVVDIAVFTGEETPRRSILPERLISTLPGLIGREAINREKARLANIGEPMRQKPDGVNASANISDPADWVNALHGYTYDSFNKDVLLNRATVKDGKITVPGGPAYSLLVIPGPRPMTPDSGFMSPQVAQKILSLVKDGATVLVDNGFKGSVSLENYPDADSEVRKAGEELFGGNPVRLKTGSSGEMLVWNIGKGLVIKGAWQPETLKPINIERDLSVTDSCGEYAPGIAWTHRTSADFDIYFISNQEAKQRTLNFSLRVSDRTPELFNPVTGEIRKVLNWKVEQGRTIIPLRLELNGSVFVIFQGAAAKIGEHSFNNWREYKPVKILDGSWKVVFDPKYGGPEKPINIDSLASWMENSDPSVKYYSGTAVYWQTFTWKPSEKDNSELWLNLGQVDNIAEVKVNGISCGIVWTAPWRVNITKALKPGENKLEISVTNTWHNRLIGDHALPESERITWTTAPYRLEGKPLDKAGLLGPVSIEKSYPSKIAAGSSSLQEAAGNQ